MEPPTFEHLDDPHPPKLDDDGWRRVRDRSRVMTRRRRLALSVTSALVIVVVVALAAVGWSVAADRRNDRIATVGTSAAATTSTPLVWVTVEVEVDHTVVNPGEYVTGTVFFHNHLSKRVSLPSARPAAWQVVLGPGATEPAVAWLDTPAAQRLDFPPGTTGIPFRASTRRPDNSCPRSSDALECSSLLPPGLARVLFVTDGAVEHLEVPSALTVTITGRGGPPPEPKPCPVPSPEPSMVTGQYCGPVPPPGNGLGPNGECTGREATVPCAAGVVAGKYYAFTLPGRCDGVVIFDGRRWISELPPPTNVSDFDVWMRLDPTGRLGFIGPRGVVGFDPDTGQPASNCQD
jgi:hypothetical protein